MVCQRVCAGERAVTGGRFNALRAVLHWTRLQTVGMGSRVD
jgi:hypothetical protein